MAKRRVNKNLVAFLTAAGIVAAVIVVAVATINAAQRDPRAIAEKAAAQEQAGDLERAMGLYRRAYGVSKDATYLIEAARCAWEMGEFADMFTLLSFAYAQAPHEQQVLGALLQRYWELRAYPIYQPWDDILTYADNLLQTQPENLLALVSKSVALERLKEEDPTYAAESDATLARAAGIDPTDPYVALVQAERTNVRAFQRAAEQRKVGRASEAERITEQARARRVEILEPAAVANPDDVALTIALAYVLAERRDWAASRQCLEAGLAQQPDSPELHLATAGLMLEEAQRKQPDATPEETQALVKEGLEHVATTVRLDAAFYRAYIVRAEFQRLGWTTDGRWESNLGDCQKEILEGMGAGLRETVGLKTVRAVLGEGERLRHIARAFDVAHEFYQTAPSEEVRTQAETYVRYFLQEGETQYPEHTLVLLMKGQVASIDRDDRQAIKAFREAEQRAEQQVGAELFSRLAKEQLIRLYRRVEEYGSSLRYIDKVTQLYEDEGGPPPRWLWLYKAEILSAIDRPQEALDLLDSMAVTYPEDDTSKAIRARVLTLLERGEEATQELQKLTSDDPRILVAQASTAAWNREYATAELLLRRALAQQPGNLSTMRLLVQVLLAEQRRDEAVQIVEEEMAGATDERQRRVLEQYHVMVSERDPEQRKQKLREIISTIPNDIERAAQSFNFWIAERDYRRAVTYLDEMEALQKDNVDVLRLQFDMALRLEECERAETYASRLAQLNADGAGGAQYRGRHELQCGNPEKALSEFRAAEREFPTDSELKIRVAQALLVLQPPRYDEAMQTLEQAIEFDPRSFMAHRLLYLCYEQTGRRAEGIPHLEAAAKIEPDDAFIKARAEILEEEKDPKAGIARREQLREQNPDDVANLLRLAELYDRTGVMEFRQGRPLEAQRLYTLAEERLQAAVQVDPASYRMARFATNLYAKHGNREAGERLLEQHLRAQQGLGKVVARVLFGRFYEMLRDPDAALSAYRRAHESVDEDVPAGSEDRGRAFAVSAGELAEFYRRTRAYQEMIDAYQAVLSHLQSTETATAQGARRNIIQGLLTLRQYGDAEQEVAAYRQDYPKDPRGLILQAEMLLSRHKPLEAREALTRVLEAHPDNAWCRYIRGRINLEQGRYREARSDFLRAKTVAPNSFGFSHRLDLARLYEITEEFELAEGELRELLPLRRTNRLVELRLIDLLRKSGQVEKAQAFVNELIAREPKESFWHYQLGRLLLAREEYSAAVRPLTAAMELTEGKAADVVEDLLSALTLGERAREATQVYENLDPAVITPLVQARAAGAYLAANQRPVAVALLEQAVDAASRRSLSDLRFVVSGAVETLGEDEGLAVLRRVYAHAGSNPVAMMVLRITLAAHLVAADDPARSAEGLEMAKAVVGATPPNAPLHVEGLMVQAVALTRAGEIEPAVQTYEDVLRHAPDNPQALNNLAYMLAEDLGRPAEALPYAERLHDLATGLPKVLDTVGWVYYLNGRVDQAEGVLREALRIEPNTLAARYHLGRLYADRGQWPVAQREFRRLLQNARALENEQYQNKAQEALENRR